MTNIPPKFASVKNNLHFLNVNTAQPFAAAKELHGYGLAVMPIGGNDDKTPLVVGWGKWKGPPPAKAIEKWMPRHTNANIGIATSPSRVTIVDIDDMSIANDCIARFGDTPVKTATPSGGLHLWYRSNGERNSNLRREGLAVDIKGVGGMVVIPPSIRRSGKHAGEAYFLVEGGWHDLSRLPSLQNFSDRSENSPHDRVEEGTRNNSLFMHLKEQARHCDTIEDLLDVGRTFAMACVPPLPNGEVEKTVRSVWRYYEDGELWHKGDPQHIVFGVRERELSRQNSDAFLLWYELKVAHGARKKPFAVACTAMARDGVVPAFGKSNKRYIRAVSWLVDNGWLNRVHTGGKKKGDCHLYTFIP